MRTRAALRTCNLTLRDVTRFLDRHYLTPKAADFLRRMSQAVLAAAAGFHGTRLSAIGGAGATAALAFVLEIMYLSALGMRGRQDRSRAWKTKT